MGIDWSFHFAYNPVLRVLFCFPEQPRVFSSVLLTFLKNKETCFLAPGKMAWMMNISTTSRKRTEAKSQHWDASGESQLLDMQAPAFLGSRSESASKSLLGKKTVGEKEKKQANIWQVWPAETWALPTPTSQIDLPCFFSFPKILLHKNHPQLYQITRQLKLFLIIFSYNHNEPYFKRCVSMKYILVTVKCFIKMLKLLRAIKLRNRKISFKLGNEVCI